MIIRIMATAEMPAAKTRLSCFILCVNHFLNLGFFCGGDMRPLNLTQSVVGKCFFMRPNLQMRYVESPVTVQKEG